MRKPKHIFVFILKKLKALNCLLLLKNIKKYHYKYWVYLLRHQVQCEHPVHCYPWSQLWLCFPASLPAYSSHLLMLALYCTVADVLSSHLQPLLLTSFTVVCFWDSPALWHVSTVCSFLSWSSIPLYKYTLFFFLHSPVDGYLFPIWGYYEWNCNE